MAPLSAVWQGLSKRQAANIAGLSLYIAWSFVLWNGPVLVDSGYQIAETENLFFIQGALTALAALVGAFLAGRVYRARRHVVGILLTAALSVAATVFLIMVPRTQSVNLLVLAFALSGMGSTLRLFWEDRISQQSTSHIAAGIVIAYLLGYVLFVFVGLLPLRTHLVVAGLFPVVAAGLFFMSDNVPRPEEKAGKASNKEDALLLNRLTAHRLAIVAFVFFGYGAVRTQGILGGYQVFGTQAFNISAGIPILMSIGGVLIVLALFRRRTTLFCYIAFPLMTLAALVPPTLDPLGGLSVFCITLLGAEIVKYALWFTVAEHPEQNPVTMLAFLGLLRAAQWTGSTLGQAFSLSVQPPYSDMAVLCCLIAALLFVIRLPEVAPANLIAADLPYVVPSVEHAPVESSAMPKDLFKELVGTMAGAYGLSARETEIAELWAQGYSMPTIAERLFISKSTVRTHLGHIYEKTNTSSKEELIDLTHAVVDSEN